MLSQCPGLTASPPVRYIVSTTGGQRILAALATAAHPAILPILPPRCAVMNTSHGGTSAFGPFRLSPARRELKRDGVPLALGDRAMDILIALAERPGEIVSHRDLIARVWRDLVVNPGNLRVHMSALRKALGDGEGGSILATCAPRSSGAFHKARKLRIRCLQLSLPLPPRRCSSSCPY